MASDSEIVEEEENREDASNKELKTEGVESEEIKHEEHAEQGKHDKGQEGEDLEKDKEDTEMAHAEVSQEKQERSEEEPEDEIKKLDGDGSDDLIYDSSYKGEEVGSKEKTESSLKEPVTPKERPTRERKTVERYSESSTGRASSASKTLSIEKGKGAQLKDIPNVAFKLSKRKLDDNLQILHTLLFGKKAKAHNLKKNIGQFSGYVWVENEERQRSKTKEKLDKCVKEKLLDFCDILNIPINKAVIKKEELSAKLLEFLESPHATTDSLLADREKKGKKRGGKATTSKTSSPTEAAGEASVKKQRKSSQVGEKHKRSSKDKKEDTAGSKPEQSDSDDEGYAAVEVESDQEINSEEIEEEDEPKKQKLSQKSSSKKSLKEDSQGKSADKSISVKKGSSVKSVKNPKKPIGKSSSAPKKDAATAEGPSSSTPKSKVSSTKKQKTEKESKNSQSSSVEEKTVSKKKSSKTEIALAKDQGKKPNKKAKVEPSTEEMHAVVVDILKEVDFNTATLSDILRQLGTHFGLDLMHRKAEIKAIITDVINSMTDEEDDEEGDDGEDTVKTGDKDKEY